MKKTFALIILILTAATSHGIADEKDCIEAIRTNLTQQNPDAARDFFQLQSKLTLHRLAWAHLTRVKKLGLKDPNAQIPKVETEIRKVMEKISKKTQDPAFAAAKENFIKSPLSRKSLADALEAMKTVLEAQSDLKESDFDYILHLEDLKTISILGELEDLSDPKASQFTKSSTSPRGILHLTKLINSAYQTKHVEDVERERKVLQTEMKRCEKALEKWVDRLGVILKKEPTCQGIPVCTDCAKTDEKERSLSLDLLIKSLNEDLKKNAYQGVRYGNVWLKTAYVPPPPTPTPAFVPTIDPKKAQYPPPPTAIQLKLNASKITMSKKELSEMIPPDLSMKKSVEKTLKVFEEIWPCIRTRYPVVAEYPMNFVEAAAAVEMEVDRPIMKSGVGGIVATTQWFFGKKQFPESVTSCKEAESSSNPTRAGQVLAILDYWNSKPASLTMLEECKYPENEKKFYSALVGLGILSKGTFENCRGTEINGMRTHRKFMNAIERVH